MLVRSAFVIAAFFLSTLACAAPAKPPATAPANPPASTPPGVTVNADLRVFTLRAFEIHQGETHGRWFRRTSQGWEAADCNESFAPDFGGHDVSCGAWTPVAAPLLPAVERAAAAGDEIDCASRKTLCDDLGLVAERR